MPVGRFLYKNLERQKTTRKGFGRVKKERWREGRNVKGTREEFQFFNDQVSLNEKEIFGVERVGNCVTAGLAPLIAHFILYTDKNKHTHSHYNNTIILFALENKKEKIAQNIVINIYRICK